MFMELCNLINFIFTINVLLIDFLILFQMILIFVKFLLISNNLNKFIIIWPFYRLKLQEKFFSKIKYFENFWYFFYCLLNKHFF